MKRILRLAALLVFCVLTFAARCHNLRDVFIDGRIYYVDADCYSRMTRARMVAEHPGMIVRHHDFENWPQGVNSHTTAPLDYLIVAGKGILDFGFSIFDSAKTSVLHNQTLDLAGALVGPLLGVVGAVFLAVWAWALRLRFWGVPLLLYAVSPILVHGTLLGRPDHQALLIVLLMAALGAEIALARKAEDAGPGEGGSRRWWGIVSGVAWALSLWVSLYEPLILFGAVLALWLALDRRALLAPERRAGWIAFAAILAVAFLLEGWRIETPDATMRAYFGNWKASIGELAHLDLRSPVIFRWLSWAVLVAPVLLVLARKSERRALPALGLLALTLALTVWQIRWGYFLAVAFVCALPLGLPVLRRGWIVWPVFIIALWPVAQEWDAQLFSDDPAQHEAAVKRRELVQLRALAAHLRGPERAPFLAPWWLSPSLAYWSGQPGVAGSSHESLPGIVDGARFSLAATPDEAAPILEAHGVRWVIVDEVRRQVSNAATVLGRALPAGEPFAVLLAQHPAQAPAWLVHTDWSESLRPSPGGLQTSEMEFYRLYRVDEASLPR